MRRRHKVGSPLLIGAAVVILLCILSAVYSGISGNSSPITRAAGTVVRPFQRFGTGVGHFFSKGLDYFTEFDALKAENEQLKQQISDNAQHIGEVVLRVGGLPQQEVGRADLARRTDDEVGIGHMRGVQVGGDGILGDILRCQLSVFHPLRDGADGVFDLVTATVVDAQRGCCRVRTKPIGNLVHLRDLRADILRQNSQVAQHAHSYAALEHGFRRFLQIGAEQVHQRIDFILRTLPVFGRKCIDREILHANVLAVGGNGAERLRADLVTGLARQTAFLGPAAVAVHDYRNMTRHRTVFGRVILLFSCEQTQPASSLFVPLAAGFPANFMQKGDESAAPNKLLHTLLAAHKTPIYLQIAPTWQDFIQKSEPLARPQATAALRRHPIAALCAAQKGPALPGLFVPRPSARGARHSGIEVRFPRNRTSYIGGL